jgi:nitronate monooxygenase
MDPDNLPEADPSKMDFDKATSGAKAWKDIWGSGQGIGAVKEIGSGRRSRRPAGTPRGGC